MNEVSGEVSSRRDRWPHKLKERKDIWRGCTHGYSQDVRELVCFCLSEAVPCVCDKNNWHHKLSLRVDQLLKCLFCCRDWHPPTYKDAIYVEQQSKIWLRLLDEREKH